MTMKSNYFFLLSPSPWPMASSLGAFNLLFSGLLLLKYGATECLVLNILIVVLTSFSWWINYSKEMGMQGSYSSLLESGLKTSMILFISSEVFFFFSFFWSYFHFFLSPSMEIGVSWPPLQILAFDFLNVPLINTLILLSSGVTVTLSHHFLMKKEDKKFFIFLFLTFALGVFFSILQAQEYNSSFFSSSDGNFGTVFFVLTGFHGIHVLIGSVYLLTSLLSSLHSNSSFQNLVSFELSSWYWHFVDVVWIFLYFFLYYANN